MSDHLGSRSRMEVAMQKVFQNDLLLEHILVNIVRPQSNRTIINPGNEGARSNNGNVSNCRLVSKHWMLTVSKVCRQEQVPLFHLRLGHNDVRVMMESEESQFQDIFNKYATSVAYWEEEEELTTSQKYPRFELELSPTFFQVVDQSVFNKLFEFLLNYGAHGMIRFILNFTGDARFHYIPTNIPQFQFNNLRELLLVNNKMTLLFLPLIQKILAGSTSLEYLIINGSESRRRFFIGSPLGSQINSMSQNSPYIFQLPRTTKKISIYEPDEDGSFNFRIPMNDLENLKSLIISPTSGIYARFFTDNLLLESIAGKVRSLNFVGATSRIFLFRQVYSLNFPVMKDLKTLTVNAPWYFDEQTRARCNYEDYLPDLKEMILVNRDVQLQDCLYAVRNCKTLEKLTVVSVDLLIHNTPGFQTVSLKMNFTWMGLINGIKESFVNLTHLEIGVTDTYINCMREIFSNLGKLKVLTIYINAGAWFTTNINWDMIFTGLPAMTCKSLMESGKESWGKWKGTKNGRRNTSIRELQDLEALYLVETTYPGRQTYEGGAPTNNPTEYGLFDFDPENLPVTPRELTGLAFYFAFMKMPKLKTLMCTKGFMPNEEIQQWWIKEKGTSIKTLRSPMLHHLLINKFSVFDKTWQC